MGEPVAVSTLMRLRSKLAGEMKACEDRAAQIRADLVHLDAVLRLLVKDVDPEALPTTKYRTSWLSKPGEAKRAVLDILREAGQPLTTIEIARRLMVQRGLDPADYPTASRIRKTLASNTLSRCELFVCEVGANREKSWTLGT
ncbi:hypothetical protein [Azospirillum sp. sgz301742]